MFVNINSSTNMALAIWGCSDVQGYPARPSARVYVGHETSLILGLITCRCSGKEPAFLLGEEEDRTREFGRNEACLCNIFSLVNQPGNDDVTFTKFQLLFSSNITATTLVIMAKNQKPIHTLTPQAPQHRSKPSCKKQIILI